MTRGFALHTQGVAKPQRYFCVLQHNQLRTFVDLSKSLCVNTWKLSPSTMVEQNVSLGNMGSGGAGEEATAVSAAEAAAAPPPGEDGHANGGGDGDGAAAAVVDGAPVLLPTVQLGLRRSGVAGAAVLPPPTTFEFQSAREGYRWTKVRRCACVRVGSL